MRNGFVVLLHPINFTIKQLDKVLRYSYYEDYLHGQTIAGSHGEVLHVAW